jgi:hypothetical protein
MTTIVLPWPDKALSPNARTHWAKKAGSAKKARAAGFYAAREAGLNKQTFAEYAGRIHLWITFRPKTRRLPDDDNCLASFKSYRDGIADALGVDDKRFVSHPFVSDVPVMGGAVEVRISKQPGGE